MLSMLSEKLHISYPIFLVIAGLLISFIPGIPHINLDPELVFTLFLPPLLFSAAWNTSWNDFWRLKRPITMLAFGLVVFTATAVAYVAHAMIPDFSLALGFLLGGIISPPDAVAATSVLQNLKVPKRVVTILEGESLINDASSLIVFRFALAAIFTGQFSLGHAGVNFLVVATMGIVIGLIIAHISYFILRCLPTSPSIDTAISIITPYLMYIIAEHFHYSGVLAVVSGGLFLTFRSQDIFSYNSRLQTQSVWSVMVFLLNGIVFIMIGLQLQDIINGLGQYSLSHAIFYAIVISLLTIIIRILWVFPGAYLPRMLSKKIRTTEENPGKKSVFIVAWSGMRGVVSLASALSVPLLLSNGEHFPHRNLILFITFIVILFTLVLQGLSLPILITIMKLKVHENEEEQEQTIRIRLATVVVEFMEAEYAVESEKISAFNRVKERYERMLDIASKQLAKAEGKDATPTFLAGYRKMLLELIDVRRKEIAKMRHEKIYSEELLRLRERELDLEEARMRK